MAAAAAGAQGWCHHQCVFDGSVSSGDAGVRRRPYHRNCGCALHHSRCFPPDMPCNARVSYPMRRSWSGQSITSLQGQPVADGAQASALHWRGGGGGCVGLLISLSDLDSFG